MLTPFFSHSIDFVPAKAIEEELICFDGFLSDQGISSTGSGCGKTVDAAKLSTCSDVASNSSKADTDSTGWTISYSGFTCDTTSGYGVKYTISYSPKQAYWEKPDITSIAKTIGFVAIDGGSISYTCPPDNPEQADYTELYPSLEGGELDSCIIPDVPCPDGTYAVKSAEYGCIPITCPNTGMESKVYASGTVYGSGSTGGTYCDGSCAYSAEGGQNPDNYQGKSLSISVVSTGSICGQGSKSEDEWFQSGDEGECTTSILDSGSSFMSCPAGNDGGEDTTPNTTPPVDLTEQTLLPTDVPTLIPIQETCTSDNPACEIRNLKETIKAQSEQQQELDIAAHNKKVKAEEVTMNKLINTLEFLNDQNSRGFDTLNTTLESGGTNGNGSSSGGTDGNSIHDNLDGQGMGQEDIEGGVGGLDDTIGEEIVNIEDYTAQYSGWLGASGECPATKDITLTIGGKTTTFDMAWAPMCDLFSLMGVLLQAAAWLSVGFMIQRSI